MAGSAGVGGRFRSGGEEMMISRLLCWLKGHDLITLKRAVMCRRCFKWWERS